MSKESLPSGASNGSGYSPHTASGAEITRDVMSRLPGTEGLLAAGPAKTASSSTGYTGEWARSKWVPERDRLLAEQRAPVQELSAKEKPTQ